MSLILEALKKSEAERQLGQVPGLSTLPILRAHPPRRRGWWLLLPILALLGAVTWSNRDLLGFDDREVRDETLSPSAESAAQTAVLSADESAFEDDNAELASVAAPPQDRVASVLLDPKPAPISAPRPMPQPLVADPEPDDVEAMRGISPENQQRIRRGELFVPNPSLLSERGPTEVDQIVDAESVLPPPLPEPDAGEGVVPTDLAQAPTPTAPLPDQRPVLNSATLPVTSPAPVAQASTVAASGTMSIHDLTMAQRQGLPALKMSMHVYHADVARRFAIIDGHRVNEGGVIGQETWAREIVPDGVIVEYRNLRFLLPRVGS